MLYRRIFSKINTTLQPLQRKLSTFSAGNAPVESYSEGVKVLHWAMGLSTLGCFAFVNAAQQTKDKKAKMNYMFIHKSFGTLAAFLLIPRLGLRVISKHPGHLTSVAWQRVAATASHTAMYGFLIAMPLSGVAMGYYGGKGLPFFFTTISGANKENKNGKLAGQAFKIHKQLGLPMEILFLLHLGGVGYHVASGHSIFARIVPGMAAAAK